MTKPQTLRDLDAMDSMLDSEFSNDAGIKISIGKKLNHPFKGKSLPSEWVTNVSNSLIGKKKPTRSESHRLKYMRGVKTPDGIFESVRSCLEYYKINECTVRDRIIKGAVGWEYVDGLTKKELLLRDKFETRKKENSKLRKIQTPWGLFNTRKTAVEEGHKQCISNPAGKISAGLKKKPTLYYYLENK